MINGITMAINIDEYLLNALKEDITSEDVTTNAIMRHNQTGRADLICKQNGIICGLSVFERVFTLLDPNSHFEASFQDGDTVKNGDLLGCITGDIRALLSGERTALNYLQRMSGIAT
ncbi:MAG: nicotinate-nucleotide diphosphorylase (carboxylating), partial [Lachnospiraceae bacterium]|nr:nicotinate-nucleotide diphosphorylase (carboxylating) [Lachnospiraceae bacterium]